MVALLPVAIPVVLLSYTVLKVYKTTSANYKSILSDELYVASSNLINADRDFYQSLVGSLNAVEGKDVEANVDEYETNYQQTIDRINAAAACISGKEDVYDGLTLDSINEQIGRETDGTPEATMTFKNLQQMFTTNVEGYYNSLNPKTGAGDVTEQAHYFESAKLQLRLEIQQRVLQRLMTQLMKFLRLHRQLRNLLRDLMPRQSRWVMQLSPLQKASLP